MQNLRRYRPAWWKAVLLAGAVSFGSFAPRALATLHGFCGASAATSTCLDNGTITPTGSNPLLQFGFTRSPDDNSGLTAPISFDLVALVPSNAPGAGTQVLTYMETDNGMGTGTLVLHAGVFTGGPMGTGTLDSFLGLTSIGGPANPFSGFLAGENNQHITGVTGFDVYVFNFGSVTFGGKPTNTDPTFVPAGTFNGALIPGTELYAYLDGPGGAPCGGVPAAKCSQDATALSSTIIETSVPDGGATVMLLGGALVGLATLRQRLRA